MANPEASDEAMIKAAKRRMPTNSSWNFLTDMTRLWEREALRFRRRTSAGFHSPAILKDAPILILDEATSSVDMIHESLIQEALNRCMKHKTTIVIAHRLSTIEHADRIYVLDHGKLAGWGTHQELLEHNSTYQGLIKAQKYAEK